ncbi:MAG: PEP-CTERM sorting domain-containing protein [Rubrivivax sp.]|nr:MAG: PEP-CTERM sorting domain-containing protein [Rubrivivax sp.]
MQTSTFSPRTALTLAAATAITLASASTHAAVAIDTTFSFDDVASGTNANLAIGSLSSLVRFDNAKLFDDLDVNGDPISGQFHWGIDTDDTLAAVTVSNPIDHWRNAAPSGINALNTADGPVLLSFNAPLTLSHFGFTLENTTYGMPSADILFLDATGHVVQTFSFQQDLSGATFQISSIAPNISAIVLPSGKFVDDVHIATSAVPEPSGVVLALLGMATAGAAIRRRRG